jgi:hypothetical protein
MQRLILCTLLAVCASSYAASPTPSDDAAFGIIRDYVLHHRHWSTRDFYIERQRDAGRYSVYDIVNRDDQKRHFRNGIEVFETGAGKSFTVYYDRRRRAVVKEMSFQ